jgi:hypothetical protein
MKPVEPRAIYKLKENRLKSQERYSYSKQNYTRQIKLPHIR